MSFVSGNNTFFHYSLIQCILWRLKVGLSKIRAFKQLYLKHGGWKQILNVNHFICTTWGQSQPINWSLKRCGISLAWTLVPFFFILSKLQKIQLLATTQLLSSDSVAQIQGWLCGLARFTDRFLKRETTMLNFLAACAFPGFRVRGWHDYWEVE